MEKEEMEEELGEKMEVLQRDLEQARASTRDTHQVEELKKVLGTWYLGCRVAGWDALLPHLGPLCPRSWGCLHDRDFQASS